VRYWRSITRARDDRRSRAGICLAEQEKGSACECSDRNKGGNRLVDCGFRGRGFSVRMERGVEQRSAYGFGSWLLWVAYPQRLGNYSAWSWLMTATLCFMELLALLLLFRGRGGAWYSSATGNADSNIGHS
jgi:hypothetical protein